MSRHHARSRERLILSAATHKAALLILLVSTAGCLGDARLALLGVPMPIVIGDRLHVGEDSSFRCLELHERYFVEDRDFYDAGPFKRGATVNHD